MITLHPEFDIATAMWFVEDHDVVAPTLAELKKALGPGIKFKDYYPNGFRAPPWPKTNGLVKGRLPINNVNPVFSRGVVPAKEQVTPTKAPFEHKSRKRYAPKPQTEAMVHRRYNHNAILDLWAKGHTGPEIKQLLGLHSSTTAATIVATYRGTDPRAVRRATYGGRRKEV